MKSYALLSTLVAYVTAQSPPAPVAINAGAPAPADFSKIQTVIVGGFAPAAMPGGQPTPQLQFTPESVVAQPGDTVRFMFMGGNHSAVQTSFNAPCQPVANGFSTGPKPNAQNQLVGAPTMDLPIKDASPLFMSTLDTANCGKGMVFVVNPPPNENLVLFKTNALKAGGPALKNAQIIAAQPVQQVASTISIAPQGNGNVQATPGAPAAGPAPSVIAGQGTTGAGQACGCMCLCGAGSFPANAGQGAFGGTVGAMPDGAVPGAGMMAPMAAPPAGTAAPAPQAPGQQGQQQPQMAMPRPGTIQINPGPPPAGAPAAQAQAGPAVAPPAVAPPAVPNAKLRRWS